MILPSRFGGRSRSWTRRAQPIGQSPVTGDDGPTVFPAAGGGFYSAEVRSFRSGFWPGGVGRCYVCGLAPGCRGKGHGAAFTRQGSFRQISSAALGGGTNSMTVATELGSLPVFAGIPTDELLALAAELTPVRARVGEVLMRQGEK